MGPAGAAGAGPVGGAYLCSSFVTKFLFTRVREPQIPFFPTTSHMYRALLSLRVNVRSWYLIFTIVSFPQGRPLSLFKSKSGTEAGLWASTLPL